MCERKFIAIKYTHPHSYAKFGTFLAPPGICLLICWFVFRWTNKSVHKQSSVYLLREKNKVRIMKLNEKSYCKNFRRSGQTSSVISRIRKELDYFFFFAFCLASGWFSKKIG